MKAFFGNTGAPIENLKNKALGTASAQTATLDDKTILIIKLTCHVLGNVDRNSFLAMQNTLSLHSSHKKEVARKIVESMTHSQGLGKILRSFRFERKGRHNTAYFIMDRLYTTIGNSGRRGDRLLSALQEIGNRLGISAEELSRLETKNGLI